MRYIILFILVFTFNGCSPKNLDNTVENMMISLSGNEPPQSFRVANLQTMKDYVFNTKDFSFSLPYATKEDFSKMGGWDGMSMRDGKTIVLGLRNSIVYHIELSVSKKAYTDRERAIENGNVAYLHSVIKIDDTDKLYIKKFGKEQYSCTVMEYTNVEYPSKKYTGYECYKHNNKGQSKSVHIRLTYNKPNNLIIAKDYTYEDLQQRAKRMLDSLYIKDGWDD